MSLRQLLEARIAHSVQWTPLPVPAHPEGEPYATHAGVVTLGEDTLEVFQLNTGVQGITPESLEALMQGPFGLWFRFLRQHPEWEDDVMLAPAGLDGIKPGALYARPEATKAFVQWAVEQGLAQHPERLPHLLNDLNYHATVERQAMARKKPKLRLLRPR